MQRPRQSDPPPSFQPRLAGDGSASALDNPLVQRARGLYLEMPGLRLTLAQARRLLGADGAECERALDTLVALAFLQRTPDGAYRRASDGPDIRVVR